jgi:hypothetical protein
MEDTRSARSRGRKARLLTNNHDCCARCRLLLSAPEDEFHFGSYDLPDGSVLWHFPIEPHWWREEWAAKRRERVIADFRLEDLGSVADLLKITIDDELDSTDDIAQAIRLFASLSWLVDVANEWFPRFQSSAQLEAIAERWQIRHADLLLEVAETKVFANPSAVIATGVLKAMVRSFDIE